MPAEPKILHEGRGGYIELDGLRYAIEHVADGRFCIHFPSGNRSKKCDAHFATLTALCRANPEKWSIEQRNRRR